MMEAILISDFHAHAFPDAIAQFDAILQWSLQIRSERIIPFPWA